MNRSYDIRREDMLAALGLPDKIPLGLEAEYQGVVVLANNRWPDRWGPRPEHIPPGETVILPRVILAPRGVANRIRVECPECGKVVRFSCLKQHIGTKVCQHKAATQLTSTSTQR